MGTYTDLIKLRKKPSPPALQALEPTIPPLAHASELRNEEDQQREPVVSRYHDTVPSSDQVALMKKVRKAVKIFGKEAATHRFTQEEKNAIAEIVYAYKKRGVRTSENEIARIAINYLFYDYKLRGDESVLHQSLQALNE